MDLSSRDLELFLRVASERSFTKAAQKCNLSQSALSSRIRSLEDGLGIVLFDRTTRSVELTAEGKLFEPSARRLHEEFSEIMENFRDHASRRKGRVKVASLPSVCASWLPGVFSRFKDKYPGIDLSLTDGLSEVCLDMVRNGDVDLAITSLQNTTEDLQATVLGTDHYHLVCLAGHPLLDKKQISAEDLAHYPFVHVSRNSSVRQHLEAALNPIALNARIEVQYMETIAGMVEAGIGISIVPALTLWQFRRPTLATRSLILPNLSRPIHLLKRRGHAMSPAAQAFYEHAITEKKSLEALTRVGYPKDNEDNGSRTPATVVA